MNSPWGTLYQIIKDTGWSWHQVLWSTSRANVMLMMADRPSFKKGKKVVKVSGNALAERLKAKGITQPKK